MKAVFALLFAASISLCFAELNFGQVCPNVYCNASTRDSGDVVRCTNNAVEFAGPGASCNASLPCFPYFACRGGVCVVKGERSLVGCTCDANDDCGTEFSGLICQNGVCGVRGPQANGASCRFDSECLSRFCDSTSGRICRAKLAINETCAYYSQCASGFCYRDSMTFEETCHNKRATGESCDGNSDGCVSGVCLFI